MTIIDERERKEKHAASALYLSCGEYSVRYLDVPDMDGKYLREYVLHRLGRIYPGDPAEIRVDVRRTGAKAEILLVNRDKIDGLRALYPKTRFFSIVRGLRRIPELSGRVVCGPDWYEFATFRDGQWSVLGRFPRTGFGFLSDEPFSGAGIQIVCARSDVAAAKAAAARADTVFSFDEAIRETSRANCIFPGGPRSHVRPGVFALAALAILFLNYSAHSLRARADTSSSHYRKALAGVKALSTQLRSLDRKLGAQKKNAGSVLVDARELGSVLTGLFAAGKNLRLTGFSYGDGHFTARGTVADALGFAESLRSTPFFCGITLSGVQIVKVGEEQFSVSGEYDER